MHSSTKCIILFLLLIALSFNVFASGEMRSTADAESNFYSSTVVPAENAIKNAMPPPASGWIKASEPTPPAVVSAKMNRLQFELLIIYKRVAGVEDEQKKLKKIYAESSKKHEDEARTAIEELIDQQSETALALRKATRRKNQQEIERLNNELDENGQKMSTLHKKIDDEIARDVEPYLVKDAEASIRISVNDSFEEFSAAESFPQPKTAFSLRKEGEKVGDTGWREGQIMLLYGDWQKTGQDSYRANIDQPPFTASAKTITIVISGDRKRIDDLMQHIDLHEILSLMKEQ